MNLDAPPPSPEKWCDLSAAGSVSESARICLCGRVGSVVGLLESTAKAGATPESVHQLRVWTRRTLAALDVYRDLIPKSDRKWFRKELKRVRESAGTARDLDVLIERYRRSDRSSHERVAKRLVKRRQRADRSVRKVYRRLVAGGRLTRRLERMLAHLKPVSTPLTDWLAERMTTMLQATLADAPEADSDYKRLHRFRIRLKRLRYVIEILGGELDGVYREQLYGDICDSLELLGNLNDHVTAAAYLKEEAERAHRRSQRRRCKRLLEQELQLASQMRDRFLEAWPQSVLAKWANTEHPAEMSSARKHSI